MFYRIPDKTPSNSDYYTPWSEPFRTQLVFALRKAALVWYKEMPIIPFYRNNFCLFWELHESHNYAAEYSNIKAGGKYIY
jgi:hypothetical protein